MSDIANTLNAKIKSVFKTNPNANTENEPEKPMQDTHVSDAADAAAPFRIENLFDVKGLVVVITGGGTGIGLMMTKAFVNNGARVYIIGRRLEVLQKTVETHSIALPAGAAIVPIQGDTSSKDSIKATMEQIQAKEPHIDILINNGGVIGPDWSPEGKTTAQEIGNSIFETDYEEATKAIQINTLGYFYVAGAFIPLLAKSPNNPQIINITSVVAFGRNLAPGLIYPITKAADTHFTKMLSTHLRGTSIRVNAIAPGVFPSEATGGKDSTTEDNQTKWDESNGTFGLPVSKSAGGGIGTEADIASTILWLGNKRSRYVSGAIILLDGGVLNEAPSTY